MFKRRLSDTFYACKTRPTMGRIRVSVQMARHVKSKMGAQSWAGSTSSSAAIGGFQKTLEAPFNNENGHLGLKGCPL